MRSRRTDGFEGMRSRAQSLGRERRRALVETEERRPPLLPTPNRRTLLPTPAIPSLLSIRTVMPSGVRPASRIGGGGEYGWEGGDGFDGDY
jgi:hypothetical protein